MTDFDPAELSAYLDGELPPARMLQIEALLAEDPALCAEYETLKRLDAGWREAGGGAVFVPTVPPPSTQAAAAKVGWLAAVVVLLLATRVGGKFIEAVGPSLLLNVLAMGIALAAVVAISRRPLTASR